MALPAATTFYLVLIGGVALERLLELRVASRNRKALLARGAVEVGAGHYPWMVALHTAFLVACPLEVLALGRPFFLPLAIPMLILLALAAALRFWVIATLDGRWTTRILVLPGAPPVAGGPFRFLRHPNYLAVILEILALPLVHRAWITAIAFTVANAWLLKVRIAAEERALAPGGYETAFAGKSRLVPGI